MKNTLLGVLAMLAVVSAAEAAQLMTVHPEETDEVLANPGMGWETFHRTSKQDRTLPPWIPSTIQYIRWGWGELETNPLD